MGRVTSRICRRCRAGKMLHASMHSLEHLVAFGVVTDVVDGGAHQGELGVTSARHPRRETRHHPGHVLQVVPTRHLDHEGGRDVERPFGHDRCPPSDVTHRAVPAGEGRLSRHRCVRSSHRPHGRQDLEAAGASESSWFLGENGSIDGGMIDTRSIGTQAGTYSRRVNTKPSQAARCGRRKSHASSVHWLRDFGADVTSPQHDGAGGLQGRHQPGRLRIVQDDDVGGPDLWRDRARRWPTCTDSYAAASASPSDASVTGNTVETVVDALGDREELGVTGDDEPAHRHADAEDVADQHLQHLGHSPAGGRRVDVPHRAASERGPSTGCFADERGVALLPDERLQASQFHDGDVDLAGWGKRSRTARSWLGLDRSAQLQAVASRVSRRVRCPRRTCLR